MSIKTKAMKSISLKLQDRILEETDRLLEAVQISRNKYINEALAYYNAFQNRRLLEEQLIRESQLVAQDSIEVLAEFEALDDEATAI